MALKKPSNKKKDAVAPSKSEAPKRRVRAPRFLRAIGSYFAGSWQELRQTKWPTRRSTWVLTLAVTVFTVGMMIFIVAVDYVFDLLFKRIIL